MKETFCTEVVILQILLRAWAISWNNYGKKIGKTDLGSNLDSGVDTFRKASFNAVRDKRSGREV